LKKLCGEDIEEHLAGARREAEAVEELLGAEVVVVRVGGDGVVGHHRLAEGVVDAQGVAQGHARGPADEGDEVDDRDLRQAGEGLDGAVGSEQRVVGDGGEAGEGGVDAAQEGAQVVVLAEEGVEAPLHGEGAAVGEGVLPGADAAAELRVVLEQGDGGAAFGEHERRGDAGDAASDDDDLGAARGAAGSLRGRGD
jgi:hypothetical protein